MCIYTCDSSVCVTQTSGLVCDWSTRYVTQTCLICSTLCCLDVGELIRMIAMGEERGCVSVCVCVCVCVYVCVWTMNIRTCTDIICSNKTHSRHHNTTLNMLLRHHYQLHTVAAPMYKWVCSVITRQPTHSQQTSVYWSQTATPVSNLMQSWQTQ